jgi:phosphate transport system substrate-binding protein
MLPVLAYTGMYYMPSVENIANGRYPLSRKLNIYVDKTPGEPLPAPIKAFLQLILGPVGQQLVQEYGSVPIARNLADSQFLALEH